MIDVDVTVVQALFKGIFDTCGDLIGFGFRSVRAVQGRQWQRSKRFRYIRDASTDNKPRFEGGLKQ